MVNILSAADLVSQSQMAASYSPEAWKVARATARCIAGCAAMPVLTSCLSYVSPLANIVAGAGRSQTWSQMVPFA